MTFPKDGYKLHKTNIGGLVDLLTGILASGKCYRVNLKQWRDKRSLPQNNLMWMWNYDVAEAVSRHSTENHSDEELHEFFKELYCPPKPVTVFGVTKMVKSTKLLDSEEMTFYLRRIEVWCAERGIKLRIPANSEYHAKGHDNV